MRKIAAITGARAEYGILYPVLKEIGNHPDLELAIIVTGMHLSPEFGYTAKYIEMDGFKIAAKVNMLVRGDTGSSMAESVGLGIIRISQALEEIKPDVLLVLGDRLEQLAAAIAGAYLNIPVAHILGGDTAAGYHIDDSNRHAITKFAHIHFAATKKHARRIIKMGEEPSRVFVVGSPALDTILKGGFTNLAELTKIYKLNLSKPILLVIQHPVSTEVDRSEDQIRETLEAIAELKHQTILIYPNADAGGRKMIRMIKKYEKYPFIKSFKSIPHQDYLGLMKIASVMVGNSSSGIIEAPSFHLPVVNIGLRQEGRERSQNVIDIGHDKGQIKRAINKALYDKKFREKVGWCKNPYGDGKASERIVRILRKIKLEKKLLQKKITY